MSNNNTPTIKELLPRIAVVFIILIIICIIIFNKNNKKQSKEDTYISCYTFSQILVKDKLKSPKSATFPTYSEDFITDKGDTIIVSAYVDAENSFGASIRTRYKATVKLNHGVPDKGTVILLE